MFTEEVIELIGSNQVSGWLVYQSDFWQEVEIGEFAEFARHAPESQSSTR